MTPHIAERRRIVQRGGLTLLLFASLASATACIFDSGGNYKGGGRIGDLTATPTSEDAGEDAPPTPTGTGGKDATATD